VLGLFLVACPICIAVALLSYRFIEAPFLRHRKRWSSNSAAQTSG
jgi:peptidoglycan/LPS O-acetylase OafA/YrhL